MSSKQVVVFDVWSKYAYFRRPYTTTTALTFNIVPRTAIEGLIGSILGFKSEEVYSKLLHSEIGIGLLNEVKKIPFSTTHIHSDFWSEMNSYLEGTKIQKKIFHTRVNLELLVEPKYRIFFYDENLSNDLSTFLRNHKTIFTPYLGTSSMIANFSYIGNFEYDSARKKNVDVFSIIPYKEQLPSIVIEKDKQYAIEQNIPGKINENRDLLSSYSVVYSPTATKIKIKDISVNTFENVGEKTDFVFLPH